MRARGLENAGRAGAAARLYRKVARDEELISLQLGGPESADSAVNLISAASCWRKAGNTQRATKLLSDVLDIRGISDALVNEVHLLQEAWAVDAKIGAAPLGKEGPVRRAIEAATAACQSIAMNKKPVWLHAASYSLMVLGSASAAVTALSERLQALGQSNPAFAIIESLPRWLLSPIVGVFVVIAGYWLLWSFTRTATAELALRADIDFHDVPEETGSRFSPARLGAISIIVGLGLGAGIISLIWFIPPKAHAQVTVEQGMPLTINPYSKGFARYRELKELKIDALEIELDNAMEYLVTATFSSPEQPELRIQRAEIGQVFNYPDEKGYQIQVLSVSHNKVTFLISATP